MTAVGVVLTLAASATTFPIIGSEFTYSAVRWATVVATARLALPLIVIGMGLIAGGVSLVRDK